MNPEEYRRIFENELTHWWYRGLHELTLQSLPSLSEHSKPTVLDAGCGTGGFLFNIQRATPVKNPVGVDISSSALSLARQRGGFPLVQASVSKLPFPANHFDAVISLDVMYHSAVPEDSNLLREVHRVLKPGGVFIVNVPAYEFLRSPHDTVIHTARRYNLSGVTRLLLRNDFSIRRATYRNTLLFPLVLTRRLLKKLWRGLHKDSPPTSDVNTVAPFINTILSFILRAENYLLRHLTLPFGSSVFCIAYKGDANVE